MVSREQIHRILYSLLLGLLAASMTTSVFLSNLAWVMLGANWLLEGGWREKWQRARESRLLQAFLVLMLVHLVWLVGNDHVATGLDDIRQKLPLLVLPLVLLTSRPLPKRQTGAIAIVYLVTVTVMTCVGLARFVTIPDLPYRSIIPTVSHIRFGLNVCFAICLVVCFLVILHGRIRPCRWRWLLAASTIWGLWMLCFLFLLQSYTSFLILALLFVLSPLLLPLRRTLRWTLWGIVALALTGLAWETVRMTHDYYGDCRRDTDMVENGSYIYRDVDSLSIAAGWHQVAADSLAAMTDNGYSVYSTLVRYLNATHRSKDSLGVVSLSADDVAAVNRGVANPVYLRHPSVRKMVYMMLFEYESYRYGGVRDFSMLERMALWRNAWHVFCQHPWLGVGTGDVMSACQQRLEADGVTQVDSTKSPHNQYLIFLVAFGLVGMVLIVFFFVRAVATTAALRTPLAWAYLLIVLLSFVSENTLGTLAGCLFATVPWLLMANLDSNQKK